jgi:hypothetical protein
MPATRTRLPIRTGEFDPAQADEADAEPAGKGLPDRLVQDLTAYRTIALRDALG